MGQAPRQFARPDVPGDVLPAGQLGQAETPQGARDGPAGVIADDERRGRAVLFENDERRWIIPSDQWDTSNALMVF